MDRVVSNPAGRPVIVVGTERTTNERSVDKEIWEKRKCAHLSVQSVPEKVVIDGQYPESVVLWTARHGFSGGQHRIRRP